MGYYGGYGYGPYGMMGYGGDWLAPIFMLVFGVLAIMLIVALVRWIVGGGRYWRARRGMMWNTSAIDILKERYAKGEIDKKQFEEMKKDLEA